MVAAWVTSQIVFNGFVQGLVYGLLAMAIVLVYRSSKVINFAIGSMGLIGSGLLVLLTVQFGVPYWFSLAIALVAGVVYGGIIELAIVRRLFTAPRVILLVATIGVSQLSAAILLAYPDIDNGRAGYPLPFEREFSIGDLRIRPALLAVIVVVPLVALALTWFLNRTLLGRTVRAAAVNPDLARLRGVNPKTISTLVWALGGGVATVAMILIGGIDGSAGTLSDLGAGTLLRALTAALVARFTSFRIALAAGVVIGLVEGVIRFNFLTTPGLVDVLLLVTVLIAVALFPRERGGDAVFSFNPRIDVMPDRLRSIFWVRHLDRIAMLTLLGLAILAPFVFTRASQHVVYASIAAFTICALSLTVLTGWAGQLSLGQMAFAGLGAFTGAALTRGLTIDWFFYIRFEPVPFALSILLAAVFVAAIAALIGSGALRVTGLLLAVSTFAFAVTAGAYIYQLDVFTPEQTTLFPRGSVFGIDLDEERTYYFVILAVLAVLVAVLGRLRRSPVGRVTLAVRDNSTTAAAYTVRPAIVKLRTFALSGAIAGLGGGLLAGVAQRVSFADSRYAVAGSLLLVSVIVIGGMSSLAGAIIGSIYVVGIPALFPANEIVPLLTSSLGLLVLLLYFPGGLANVVYRIRGAIYRKLESGLPPITKVATAAPTSIRRAAVRADTPEVPLRTRDIVVTFGGVCANDRVSIEVRRNEIVGLIGTNGAGKSTLMNAIGGFVPSSGTVELMGNDVSNLGPAIRARHGLGRSFQAAALFPELTVRDSISVALEARGRSGMVETLFFSPRARRIATTQRSEASELIDFLGLGRYADRPISELSTGTRRIVELGGLLALGPAVLCLDEPTAGIAQREAEAMGPLLIDIRRELDAAMLIIEHDMPLIMSMSDRVYCLELGTIIAEGEPNTVRNDPKVIASYLGMDERTIDRSDSKVQDDSTV
jgi:ABC-type branched-subunit amino acid transport system ATPase component/ABC-type branched-subunit amino acid transport system permease subunit